MKNICLQTDAYKVSHWLMYPDDLERTYSYFECRRSKYDKIVFFGLQYYMLEYLCGKILTYEKICEAEQFWNMHFGEPVFNTEGWMGILDEYKGYLPIKIYAKPEFGEYKVGEPLMAVESSVPWLTGWVEGLLLKVWYPTTVASRSRNIYDRLVNVVGLNDPCYRVHDFGYRGVSSEESAALGSAGHLLSFKGTDTPSGMVLLQQYYGWEQMSCSIPASEHSVIMSHKSEEQAHAQILESFPSGLVASVSDTYDVYDCVKSIWCGSLKDQVESRDGCLVVRPDSGDYLEIVPDLIEILGETFGWADSSPESRLLNSKVRVIQGDGMDEDTIIDLYLTLKSRGLSPENLTVGSGGGLLQKMSRDTLNCALKLSWCEYSSGETRDVCKASVDKASKSGRFDDLDLVFEDGRIVAWS